MNEKLIEKLLDLAVTDKGLVKELLPYVLSQDGKQTAEYPFEVGKQYFIRTVTYHSAGRVQAIVGSFLILEKGSWIADSGRFSNALKEGFENIENSEIEPYPGSWIVNIGSIVDACEYMHSLPVEQK